MDDEDGGCMKCLHPLIGQVIYLMMGTNVLLAIFFWSTLDGKGLGSYPVKVCMSTLVGLSITITLLFYYFSDTQRERITRGRVEKARVRGKGDGADREREPLKQDTKK